MNGKSYTVYVLSNEEGRYYIGLSEEASHRVAQHNAGVSTWTRHRGPWRLVWTQGPMTLAEASRLERLLKRQKGGAGFFRMTGLEHESGS